MRSKDLLSGFYQSFQRLMESDLILLKVDNIRCLLNQGLDLVSKLYPGIWEHAKDHFQQDNNKDQENKKSQRCFN